MNLEVTLTVSGGAEPDEIKARIDFSPALKKVDADIWESSAVGECARDMIRLLEKWQGESSE